ncbi:hypothetical protein [Hyalangium sp.]|uniref:hypothetical protein n=1 Tax=Hyalangium sp. TaxID=2028555 RepID=UPI002D266185|nr:hypothetical protein [Hyalangium sp.]HYH99184.1 hypothetical protein [Hyalangium sp.]
MTHPRGVRARVRAVFKFFIRVLRFLFILGLVVLPSPLVMALVVILDPNRRNLPAEVLRKKE